MTTSRAPSKKQPASRLSQFSRLLIPIVVILLAVTAGLYWIKHNLVTSQRSEDSVAIKEGTVLPDFKLTTLGGKEKRISDIKAKLILINFWATWCESCIEEMPSIVKLREAYHDKGFEVVGVNVDENPESIVPKVMENFRIKFPIFKDDVDGSVAKLFDVHAIPLSVIINEQRKILFAQDGGQNWNSKAVQNQVERWLSQ